MSRWNIENFQGSETILYNTMMVACHYTFVKPIEYTILTVSPNINYELWVIMMCQWRLPNCNKCTTLVWDFDCGRGCAYVETGDVWEISEPSTQFYCEPKIALKK